MFIRLAQTNLKYMKYCRNAYHIYDFDWRMLYRKEDYVKTYFQTYDLMQKYHDLDDLYKDENFDKINPEWGKEIKSLNMFFKMIPAKAKDSSIGTYKYILETKFDLKNLTMTKKQLELSKRVDDMHDLQTLNADVLDHIRMGRYDNLGEASNTLIDILKKVMVL